MRGGEETDGGGGVGHAGLFLSSMARTRAFGGETQEQEGTPGVYTSSVAPQQMFLQGSWKMESGDVGCARAEAERTRKRAVAPNTPGT